MKSGEWLVNVDGSESRRYEGIVDGTIGFSEDGSSVVWVAARHGKQFLVVNGVDGPGYDAFLNTSATVFDSKASVHGLFVRGTEIVRVGIDIPTSV